jgi:Ig-like domain from next to BRCA1 gene
MHNSLHKLKPFLLISFLFLGACSALSYDTPGPLIPGLAQTLAAETMAAQQQFQLNTKSEAQLPDHPDALPTYEYAPTSTPAATGTPVPMLTPFQSNPQAGLAEKCLNAAVFIQDVTVPDNEIMKKGQRFVKTWQFKNSGSCTWTPDYSIVFVWGDQMEGETPKPIGKTIPPGQTVEISTELRAPSEPGEYQGSWSFLDSNGQQFGTGSQAKQFFWVAIIIPGRLDWSKEGGCKIGG